MQRFWAASLRVFDRGVVRNISFAAFCRTPAGPEQCGVLLTGNVRERRSVMRRSLGSSVDVGVFGAAIISAAPFVLVMIGLCYSLFRELRTEPLTTREPRDVPEPGRAASRPTGAPAPQQFRAERDGGER